jgi:hypothetical protein
MKTLAATAAALALLALAVPARAETVDLRVSPEQFAPAADARLQLQLQLGSPGEAAPRATTLFGLPRNMGPIDRTLRIALAATLVGVGAYRLSNDSPNKGLSYALMGVAAVPAATGATGYCPLYQLLGVENSF